MSLVTAEEAAIPQPDTNAAAPPASTLASLPFGLVRAIGAALPTASRASLRLACRALAAALADAFSAVRADPAALAAGGPAAAASLARACPRATRAVVTIAADAPSPPPPQFVFDMLFETLARTKPHLESITIEERHTTLPAGRARDAGGPAAAAARRAARALARAPFGAGMALVDLPPYALAIASDSEDDGGGGGGGGRDRGGGAAGSGSGGNGSGEPAGAGGGGGWPFLLLPRPRALRLLPGLRGVVAREAEPDLGPGMPGSGLQELGMCANLTSLTVDLSTAGGALHAWSALNIFVHLPAARSLVDLRIGCAGPGEIEVPWEWLLRLPRLARLDLGRGAALDLSDLTPEALAAAAADAAGGGERPPAGQGGDDAGAARATAGPAAAAAAVGLPPLEHLSLDQVELDSAGWRALASGDLLGARLTSLQLWRCGAPPDGFSLSRPRGAAPPAAAAAAAAQAVADAAAPFAKLQRLHLGSASAGARDLIDVAAALPSLRCLSLHLSGGAAFGAGDPPRLAALTRLSRLVMMPVDDAAGAAAARWSGRGGRVPATPEESQFLRALPELRFYSGPVPGGGAGAGGGGGAWAAEG